MIEVVNVAVDVALATALKKNITVAVRRGMQSAAKPLRAAIVAAYQEHKRTGNLARSVRNKFATYKKGQKQFLIIGPSFNVKGNKKHKGARPPAYAGWYLERGTTHSQPRYTLKRAADPHIPKYTKALKAEIGKRVSEVLAKHKAK